MMLSKQFGCLLSAKCFERNYSIMSYGKNPSKLFGQPNNSVPWEWCCFKRGGLERLLNPLCLGGGLRDNLECFSLLYAVDPFGFLVTL